MDATDPKVTRRIGKYTMTIDRSSCIGAATCVALAPKAWGLDNGAKAVILDTADQESSDALLNAAKGCPVAAITIIDNETGKQAFP